MDQLHLIGLDFGSTTSSAIIASARVLRNFATGRMELSDHSVTYRSELVFTPFSADQIDEEALAGHLDRWIGESRLDPSTLTSGGVIITGLAAQKANVDTIEALVKKRVSEALFATAEDPCLESWLAFMGSCLSLSRGHPDTYFLNLDIGGGTTNLALGINGEVFCTGSIFAGARHLQFVTGSYRISALSPYAIQLLRDLKIPKSIGESLSPDELRSILDFYVTLIEAAACGDRSRLDPDPFRLHEQVAFRVPTNISSPVITLSGGVGELVYNRIRGQALPPTTAYGDLGIDLALRLLESPVLSRDLSTYVPMNLGYATVLGLCLYSTEVSGTTLYLPDPDVLPLRDLPIVAKLRMDAPIEDVERAIDLVSRSVRGGGIEIIGSKEGLAVVKKLGTDLAAALRHSHFPVDRPLVLFVSQNVGKTIGSYASDWGRLPVNLIVIDEVVSRSARFARLGAMRDSIVPVSFYGMQ